MEPTNFRNLVMQISGKDITSEQAKVFLQILGEELNAAIVEAQRQFVIKHFGKKA